MWTFLLFALGALNGFLAYVDFTNAALDGGTLFNTFLAGVLLTQSFYHALGDE